MNLLITEKIVIHEILEFGHELYSKKNNLLFDNEFNINLLPISHVNKEVNLKVLKDFEDVSYETNIDFL